ncbi:class I SAM-dependent methyltransferase [Candidatus Pelagibacter sp.]|nr:class I SAM-dependent methyltransferase [Candidatus Pelagibacter sp.]
MICQCCQNNKNNKEVKNYNKLIKISSDERYASTCCSIFICNRCSLIQKKIDSNFIKKLNFLYKIYKPYPSKLGNENLINIKDKEYYRSDLILKKINKKKKLINLNILDFGCGSGFTLSRISKLYPNNNLYGFDHNHKYSKKLKQIKYFKKLFINNLKNIDKKFDIVILNHVFEHLINPILYLKKINKILNKDGVIMLQMPNIEKNFTDILTFDHICYYDKKTLKNLLINSNLFRFSIENVIKKEITCILYKRKIKKKINSKYIISDLNIDKKIFRLNIFAQKLNKIKSKKSYIFGTTVPAIWVSKVIGKSKFQNFVEEDYQKINKIIHQKRILSLNSVKKNYNLIVPYPKVLQKKIIKKIGNSINKKKLYLL